MVKWLKILLISIFCIIVISLTTFLVIYFTGFKGQQKEDLDFSIAGENYSIAENTKSIEDCTPQESFYTCVGKLKLYNSYKAVVSGNVTAPLTNQVIHGEKYFSNNQSLYISKSQSSFVSVGKQIYIDENNNVKIVEATDIAQNKWEDFFTSYTYSSFIDEYGTDYREISNYVINDKTIQSAQLLNKENNLYTYEIVLNASTATLAYRVNMQKMGNLTSLPQINYSKLTITMNKDFEPVSVTCYDEYMVERFVTVNCVSTITTTYSSINQTVTIPNIDFLRG